MDSIKVLENFEPYNDIWYDNCFYHALFPIVSHFNKDIKAFISNNIFTYEYDNSDIGTNLKMVNISNITNEEIIKDLGFELNVKVESSSITDDLIHSIDKNKPVIIQIDCYYESIRPDTYKKNHCAHALLIYGYNKMNQEFNIIEHNYRDSLLFEKRMISFADLINSYKGYLDNLRKSDNELTYFEFFCSDINPNEISKNVYEDIYSNNFKKNQTLIYRGLEFIPCFARQIENIASTNEISQYTDRLLSSINNIINAKSIEKYSVVKIFNIKKDCISICENIINNWSFIRGIIAKCRFTSSYNIKSIEKSVAKLIEIYQFEKNWYDELLKFLNSMEKNYE